jgi:hypothetical protein
LGAIMTASTRRWGYASAVLATAIALGICARASTETIDEPALLREIGFSEDDIQRIARGELVARSLEADGSTIALAVAATFAVPPVFYLEKFRDIESFKRTQEVLKVGRFGRDPTVGDLAGLILDQEDIEDLKGCLVADCGMKLDAHGIQAVASRGARIDSASAAFRTVLATYVRRYLQTGNSALMTYEDGSAPVRIADHLAVIAKQTAYLRRWPATFDAVFNFNAALPTDLESWAYWSKEKVGPRAVVSVTHVIISPPREAAAVVATKQIYGSHYGYASLGTTLLLDKGTPDGPRIRIVYVNRSRVDVFGGILGPIKRPLVRSRAREAAERMMKGLKERLEAQYRSNAGD